MAPLGEVILFALGMKIKLLVAVWHNAQAIEGLGRLRASTFSSFSGRIAAHCWKGRWLNEYTKFIC